MSTTTNLADFGHREIKMLRDLLDTWLEQGLPTDFDDSGVQAMMNRNSGNVFLTNEEYQVAMLNGDKLESFYNSPYDGKEGFFDELLAEFEDMCEDDQAWFWQIASMLGREDEMPKEGK